MGIGDFSDLLQLGIRQNGLLHLDAAAGLRRLFHDIRFRADVGHQRHDQLLANRINRRVGDLREELLEILEQELGALGEHRQGGIGSHGGDRFFAGDHHRREHHLELLDGIAKRLLALADRRMVRLRDVQWFGQFIE